MEEAAKNENWPLVHRALELYPYNANSNNNGPPMPSLVASLPAPSWLTSDLDSIATMITARNQQVAGQYRLAVANYQRVLRGTGRHVPAEAVGLHMAEIQKSHPEAFDEAVPPPLSSPASGTTQPPIRP